jgi:hypothetical protein
VIFTALSCKCGESVFSHTAAAAAVVLCESWQQQQQSNVESVREEFVKTPNEYIPVVPATNEQFQSRHRCETEISHHL